MHYLPTYMHMYVQQNDTVLESCPILDHTLVDSAVREACGI